jgi:hypothetical protein
MSRWLLSRILATLVVLALSGWSGAGQTPSGAQTTGSASRELPSDADMIAHFQTHRAEFEELVRLYQTDKRRVWRYEKGNLQPFETNEYKALLKRAGIRHLSGDGALWLPDPYSSQTAQKAKAMDVFHAYAYHGIGLYIENMTTSLRVGGSVWKEYFYVPVVPMVEKGRLWWPRSRHRGDQNRSARVFDSLDDYPAEWLSDPPLSRRECVYRQIELQWFLSVCHS